MLGSSRSLVSGVSAAAFLVAVSFAGCGGGGGDTSGGAGTTTGDSGDGKYHATPDGVHITEKAACDALVKKQETKLLDLHCVGTGQTCPSFLRAEFQTPCMEYDQGSVEGCIAYYDQQYTCDALKNSFDNCVVTPYPGTEPAGCPTTTGGTGGTGGTTTSTGGSSTSSGTISGSGGAGGSGGLMSGSSGVGTGGMTGSGTASSGSGSGGGAN
jgi:hypothetical protein